MDPHNGCLWRVGPPSQAFWPVLSMVSCVCEWVTGWDGQHLLCLPRILTKYVVSSQRDGLCSSLLKKTQEQTQGHTFLLGNPRGGLL